MDHCAGGEEEGGLEDGVAHQVHHAARVSQVELCDGPGHADAEHHVPYLADGRVCEHFLELGRDHGLRGRDECGQGSDPSNDLEEGYELGVRDERDVEYREDPGNEVDACLDHRGGVYERADGGRAGHGVGEPFHQRELRGLADGSAEYEQGGRQEQELVGPGDRGHSLLQLEEVGSAERDYEQEDADQHQDVAEPGHHERLHAAVGRGIGLLALAHPTLQPVLLRVPVPEAD